MKLPKVSKEDRVLAIQTAFNTKSTVYLCKGVKGSIVLRGSHNYGGKHIEKAVYLNNEVKVYDSENKEVAKQAGKKVKASRKLSNSADAKSSGDTKQ